MSYQRVVIVGNLGKDPESRFTQSGSAVANMSVAVSERVKHGEKWEDHTEWFRVVAFGKTAELASQHLSKGRKVLVEGRLRQSTFEKKDGGKGYSIELIADRIVFLSPKGEHAAQHDSGSSSARAASGGKHEPAPPQEEAFDDDLPF